MNSLYFETSINASKAATSKFLLALNKVRGHFTSSFSLASNPKGSNTIFFMVCIPEGKEQQFMDLTGCELKQPIKVYAN
jgi:hypothetical protein